MHKVDGVIALETYRNGTRFSRFDLNREGKAIRRCFFEGQRLKKREYLTRSGELAALEVFDEEGYILEQSYDYHEGANPEMRWTFERGVPMKLVTTLSSSRFSKQGPGTYENREGEWIKVE